jgi:hypothetical protein
MNVKRDPDAILAAWLEEGPGGLPEVTRRAIAVNTRTTNQRRRPIWELQRRPSMNPFARIAVAAIALIALIGGAVYVFGPTGGVGGPPAASPSPTSSPSPRATATPPAARHRHCRARSRSRTKASCTQGGMFRGSTRP